MGVVNKIYLDGYKVFYRYYNDSIFVFVNKQSQFKAGQRDVLENDIILSEEMAVEARSLESRKTIHPGAKFVDAYRKHLQVNNFDLEEE